MISLRSLKKSNCFSCNQKLKHEKNNVNIFFTKIRYNASRLFVGTTHEILNFYSKNGIVRTDIRKKKKIKTLLLIWFRSKNTNRESLKWICCNFSSKIINFILNVFDNDVQKGSNRKCHLKFEKFHLLLRLKQIRKDSIKFNKLCKTGVYN